MHGASSSPQTVTSKVHGHMDPTPTPVCWEEGHSLQEGFVSSGSKEFNAQKPVLHFSEVAPAKVENDEHN